jgi:hypothetical protein
MRGLAAIGLEAFEEWGDICACFQGEVFASDGAITGRIAEVEYLTGDCAGNVETRLDILFCDSHVFFGIEMKKKCNFSERQVQRCGAEPRTHPRRATVFFVVPSLKGSYRAGGP